VINCPHAQKEILSPKTNEEAKDKAAAREGLCAFSSGCGTAKISAQ
jgi:hypothetical protein